MARDKKARETGLAWVYPRALGEGVIDESVEMADVERLLREFLRAECG